MPAKKKKLFQNIEARVIVNNYTKLSRASHQFRNRIYLWSYVVHLFEIATRNTFLQLIIVYSVGKISKHSRTFRNDISVYRMQLSAKVYYIDNTKYFTHEHLFSMWCMGVQTWNCGRKEGRAISTFLTKTILTTITIQVQTYINHNTMHFREVPFLQLIFSFQATKNTNFNISEIFIHPNKIYSYQKLASNYWHCERGTFQNSSIENTSKILAWNKKYVLSCFSWNDSS